MRNGWKNYLITNKPKRTIWVERLNEEVTPRFLGGAEYEGSLTKKREALAQWMTDRSNPYFSRAIVNRIWKHFMGRAFVEPIDGFGEENLPTNPELLDWLAEDFIIHDYDLQTLNAKRSLTRKLISVPHKRNKSNKDDELYYSHAYVKPLSAETVSSIPYCKRPILNGFSR